ncbi:unnamed protein product [Bemisia tabaci]|uniref:Tyrosine-protein phosphatase domain-containing protein n=1 Tax=Bemisia tabaci TaxID=7038 RepID=A0A9P0A724_BEMTA|nr:unnamed protein product [Bemisia tabaci]
MDVNPSSCIPGSWTLWKPYVSTKESALNPHPGTQGFDFGVSSPRQVAFTSAQSPVCPSNGYPDILPYDENRIRLSPSKENKLGYVNASHITASVGNQQRFYIAAQSPLLTTVSNFWQMVWEMDVYLIIQLNSSANENTVKYYPLVPEKPLLAGDMQGTPQVVPLKRFLFPPPPPPQPPILYLTL